MSFKKIIIPILYFLYLNGILLQGQDSTSTSLLKERKESLKSDIKEWKIDIAEAQKEVKKLEYELKYLEDSLKVYPIWSIGVFGTLGFNFSRFANWLSKNKSNTAASTFGYTFNSFFNLEQKKYFWKNSLSLNQNWLRFDDKTDDLTANYEVATDAFNSSSLFGYKFSEKLATSALLEYRTALLEGRLNNPGFLDFGVGFSWTPKKDMVIALHPLNYNAIFSKSAEELKSSFGLKIISNYSKKFLANISWTTQFSGFFSYRSDELNNWIWSNGLSKTIKKIGIGLDIALKQSQLEAKTRGLEENLVQFYYILGLSYKF